LNGYTTLEQIERDLIKASEATKSYMASTKYELNTVGITRIGLRIANPECTLYFDPNKRLKTLSQKMIEMYSKYRELIN